MLCSHPQLTSHFKLTLGRRKCPDTLIDKVRIILHILETAVKEMNVKHYKEYPPALILDEANALLLHQREIIHLLQDFAKRMADSRLLTIV